MALKARTLVGLDVHARQTHAAIVHRGSGKVAVSKLRVAPEGVVAFLQRLGPGVLAVYEAGPIGFGLARNVGSTESMCVSSRRGRSRGRRGIGSKPTGVTRSVLCACWPPAS